MFGALLGMVPMAFMNGLVAFLFWGYTTVLTPANYLYGFMQDVRFNFIFAAIALSLLVLGKTRLSKEKVTLSWAHWLIIIFFIHANLTYFFGFTPNPLAAERYENFIKGFAFVLAVPFFVKDRYGIYAILIMIALGLGLHGVVEGLKFIVSGGVHQVSGVGNSSLNDNNLFALGMVIVLPILLFFFNTLREKYARYAALSASVLTILTIIATNSRGGFLAMSVLGVWYFIASRRKGFAALALVVGVVLVFSMAPDSWFERVSTIGTASDDQSFMNRVAAWRVSLSIGMSNPIFGGGFSAVQNFWIWDQYKDMSSIFAIDMSLYSAKAAHSIYFQVIGDMGFVGLALYLFMFYSAHFNRKCIRSKIKKSGRTDMVWAVDMADTMFLSLFAFMVGGAGVSLPYYEIIFILIGLLATLNTIVDKKITSGAQ